MESIVNKSIKKTSYNPIYYEKYKQYYKKYYKQYNITKNDIIRHIQSKYRLANKNKSKQYYQDNKQKKKQYYQDNKQKRKQYYQNNKDNILIKKKIKNKKLKLKYKIMKFDLPHTICIKCTKHSKYQFKYPSIIDIFPIKISNLNTKPFYKQNVMEFINRINSQLNYEIKHIVHNESTCHYYLCKKI